MATKQTAFEHLGTVVEDHARSLASTRVTITVGEARDLYAKIAMLTDTVVMAAELWFDEIKDQREADYASECLHETAADLVKANPRLKGAFRGGA
jgi:hypothetical protein